MGHKVKHFIELLLHQGLHPRIAVERAPLIVIASIYYWIKLLVDDYYYHA